MSHYDPDTDTWSNEDPKKKVDPVEEKKEAAVVLEVKPRPPAVRRGRFRNDNTKRPKLRCVRSSIQYFEDTCKAWRMRVYSDIDAIPFNPKRDDEDSSDEDEVEEIVVKLLTVKSVRFNIEDNSRAHHTDEYALTQKSDGKAPSLVVRRGQPFDIDIDFDRAFDEEKEDLKLIFATGKFPSITNATKVEIILSKEDMPGKWGAAIKEKNGQTIKLKIFTPPDCYVGKWCFQVRAFSKTPMPDKPPVCKVYAHSPLLYILFNPWCKDDQVYHHDKDLLEEYVLNESGRIFIGGKRSIYSRVWDFGQFENPVLDCILGLFDQKNFRMEYRGDPVKIVRRLTSLVNSNDNDGIVVGNWSGEYQDGTSPCDWASSVDVMKTYCVTKEPVCFGQCWVFSAILTTCCRALGIPARSVTNFDSAHDTDGSMTIDRFFDEKYGYNEELSTDSIWNFHVWNDAWMARPDLNDKDYGGWQACDATPQETSDGIYSCGPCPLLAIKRGEVDVKYDAAFIFAEVNGDVVEWTQSFDGSMSKKIKENKVGFNISTKRPACLPKHKWCPGDPTHDEEWQDVTSEYKYTEDPAAERAAVLRANQHSTRRDIYDKPEEGCEDVVFKSIQKEKTCLGEAIEWEYSIENKSKDTRTIGGLISLRSMYYTGVVDREVSKKTVKEVIPPGKVIKLKLAVPFDEYFGSTKEQYHFSVYFISRVEETSQVHSEKDIIVLKIPDMTIKAPGIVTLGEKFQVEVSFTNPLPTSLTGTGLTVHGPGERLVSKYKPGLVANNETFEYQVDIIPQKRGKRSFTILFNSKELTNITGLCVVEVKNA